LKLDLTLELVDDDPPAIRMLVTLDGQVLVNERGISAQDCLAIATAVEHASSEASGLRAHLREAVAQTASNLQAAIADVDRRQQARKSLLTDWQPVLNAP
jgi:hypothetical protein